MKRLVCWWLSWAGTWLDPGIWGTRIRILLGSRGYPLMWPGITYSAHLRDTDHPRFVVEGDREHEYLICTRCGAELYEGWRPFYGALSR